ncbi:MAG: U32 family peptidase [Lachnospiraceae bacterium]|nr:U32 family peptidase [Lachnospiraceae bacterium]
MRERRKPELLAPAKSLEILKTDVRYGADAVYIGGEAYGLRAKADNFNPDEMREGIAFAHEHGVKVYVTANIFAHNDDIEGIQAYFRELREIGPDAVLIADPGVFGLAREIMPEIPIHVSTQANNTNYLSANFWYKEGATRIVTARELSLEEIKTLREKIPKDMEIESFVHGAMCISYSGRCLLSNYFTGRDANQGECTHPCRWKYALVEETRPGQYFPIAENERGSYIMNSKDLCMIDHIPDLFAAGIDSFKIEGRMKTALYAATVVRTYRKAIDDFMESEDKYRENLPWYDKEIRSCTYRPFTTGFFYGKPSDEAQIYDSNTYEKGSTYLGTIRSVENGFCQLTQKNKFSVGETIEIMKTDGRNLETKVLEIRNAEGEEMESAPHASEELMVRLDQKADPYDILRRQEEA